MNIAELFLLALGLSMDAFAVSVCKGLATPRVKIKHVALCGLWFGGFQALMPFIGFLLGRAFAVYIESFDHWIAFVLIGIIGIGMIREAFDKEEECDGKNASFAPRVMVVMAIATSIDALAAGITLAMPGVNIVLALALIGVITFMMSAVGVKIGNVVGCRFAGKASIFGGTILVIIGLEILITSFFN